MSRKRATRCAISLGVGLLFCASITRADEPLPRVSEKPQAEPQSAAGAEKTPEAAPKKEAGKDGAKPEMRKEAAKQKAKKSLIAPPSLLLQAPSVQTYASPGLGKLDLNRASLEQLQRLPGVGLTWAPRILAGRPYRTMGDLARDGIPFTTIDAVSQEVELGP